MLPHDTQIMIVFGCAWLPVLRLEDLRVVYPRCDADTGRAPAG